MKRHNKKKKNNNNNNNNTAEHFSSFLLVPPAKREAELAATTMMEQQEGVPPSNAVRTSRQRGRGGPHEHAQGDGRGKSNSVNSTSPNVSRSLLAQHSDLGSSSFTPQLLQTATQATGPYSQALPYSFCAHNGDAMHTRSSWMGGTGQTSIRPSHFSRYSLAGNLASHPTMAMPRNISGMNTAELSFRGAHIRPMNESLPHTCVPNIIPVAHSSPRPPASQLLFSRPAVLQQGHSSFVAGLQSISTLGNDKAQLIRNVGNTPAQLNGISMGTGSKKRITPFYSSGVPPHHDQQYAEREGRAHHRVHLQSPLPLVPVDKAGQLPKPTYAALITLCIAASESNCESVANMYAFVGTYAHLVPGSASKWHNAVRYNLTKKACFVKRERKSKSGKALVSTWAIDVDNLPRVARQYYFFFLHKRAQNPSYPPSKVMDAIAGVLPDRSSTHGTTVSNHHARCDQQEKPITPLGSKVQAAPSPPEKGVPTNESQRGGEKDREVDMSSEKRHQKSAGKRAARERRQEYHEVVAHRPQDRASKGAKIPKLIARKAAVANTISNRHPEIDKSLLFYHSSDSDPASDVEDVQKGERGDLGNARTSRRRRSAQSRQKRRKDTNVNKKGKRGGRTGKLKTGSKEKTRVLIADEGPTFHRTIMVDYSRSKGLPKWMHKESLPMPQRCPYNPAFHLSPTDPFYPYRAHVDLEDYGEFLRMQGFNLDFEIDSTRRQPCVPTHPTPEETGTDVGKTVALRKRYYPGNIGATALPRGANVFASVISQDHSTFQISVHD